MLFLRDFNADPGFAYLSGAVGIQNEQGIIPLPPIHSLCVP